MNVDERIKTLRLLEKMSIDKAYSEKLGIIDRSRFRGNSMEIYSRRQNIKGNEA